MIILEILFWASLGAILWTHVGYPLFVAALAVVRRMRVAKEDIAPSVAVVIAAHNEEGVIERLVESLLAQDYPGGLEVVVASDASTDGMDALVERLAERDGRVRLVRCPRGGKVAAQNQAVRTVEAEVVAFADAGAVWEPDALRKLVRSLADPKVGYVAGKVSFGEPEGTNREGLYWRYELWLRGRESAAGSITGGNGAIYAVRRADYVEVDPRFGHDLTFPYVTVQQRHARGLRRRRHAPGTARLATSRTSTAARCACSSIAGSSSFGAGCSAAWGRCMPSSSSRTASFATRAALLHVVLLATSLALVTSGLVYELVLAAQLALLVLALAGRLRIPIPGAAIAYYYVLVTWATVAALFRYARFGVPPVWEKVEGTR